MMAVRRARSAWTTRAAADWTRACARVTSAATMSWVLKNSMMASDCIAALLLDPRQVADPEGFELPEGLIADVVTAPPLVEAAVGAEAEDPGLDHLVGGLEAVDQDVGEERARLLPADRRHRRLDQRLVRGELGAVGQGDRHQVVERPAGVDQGDLEVVVLQRHDHRAGVEPQHLRQVGALDPPLLPRRDGLLLEVGEHVPGPVDLDLGDQLLAQLRDPLDQVVAPLDGVEGAGVHPPVLVHPEVGVGGLQQGVVLRGLDVPVRAFRTCRATRGWKMASVVATVPHRPAPP